MKLRGLTEAECYERCHGRGDPNVRIVARVERNVDGHGPPRASLPVVRMSGEDLRRLFEERLDSRRPGDPALN